MKKYKFIFWDMDGTLANTYEGVTNCVKYAMEPYGIHLEGEEELRKFIGPPLRFSFTTYCGLSEEEAEKAIVRYRERYIQCRQVLEKFDLLTELDEVVGASHDGRIDTKIEVLQEAFRRMKAQYADFSKEQTVLIGDTHYDADGAKEGGIDCIGVGYGFGGAEEMWNAGAVAVYEDQKALREALV